MLIAGLFALASCKKSNENISDTRNALAVTFSILNVGNTPLEVAVDTFKISIPNGRYDASQAIPLHDENQTIKLTITEKATGKLVMEKNLKKEDGRTYISFFYMNGAMGKMPEVPPVETGKITLTYMFLPTKTNYTEPVDIAVGKYYLTPKVFEEIGRIKNVKPGEFTQSISVPTFPVAGHVYNGQTTSATLVAYIYKAGTNTFYIDGTNYTWNPTGSTAPKPASTTAVSKLYIFSENATTGYMTFLKNFEI